MTDRYIRQSAIKKYKRCRRSWLLSYVRNLEPLRDPLAPAAGQSDIGTLVHLGVEHYYRGLDPMAAIGEAERVIEDELRHAAQQTGVSFAGIPKAWADAFRLSEIMVSGYVDWCRTEGVDAEEETLLVEEQMQAFAGTFYGDDVYVTGKIDRVVRNRHSGMVIIEDTKTVQSLDIGDQLAIDDQLQVYAWLLEKSHGLHATEARHNQIRKVKRSATARPPFYSREAVTLTDEQRANHILHMMSTLAEMTAVMQTIEADPESHHRVAYPTPTRDCRWDCPVVTVCPSMDNGDDWEGLLANWYHERETT